MSAPIVLTAMLLLAGPVVDHTKPPTPGGLFEGSGQEPVNFYTAMAGTAASMPQVSVAPSNLGRVSLEQDQGDLQLSEGIIRSLQASPVQFRAAMAGSAASMPEVTVGRGSLGLKNLQDAILAEHRRPGFADSTIPTNLLEKDAHQGNFHRRDFHQRDLHQRDIHQARDVSVTKADTPGESANHVSQAAGTLVSTHWDPGVGSVAGAARLNATLAVLRVGNKDSQPARTDPADNEAGPRRFHNPAVMRLNQTFPDRLLPLAPATMPEDLPPTAQPHSPPSGDGPEMISPPAPETSGPPASSQVLFRSPDRMQVRFSQSTPGSFDSDPLFVPARYNFGQGNLYRLKLTNIPGRPGLELFPTLEIAPATPGAAEFLDHSAIPVELTEEDFDQVVTGNFVTKVLYLPDPENQALAVAGVETLVSTRLDPGVDPVMEADRRGSILAILRVGNKDPNAGGGHAGGKGLPAMAPGTPWGKPMATTPVGLNGPPQLTPPNRLVTKVRDLALHARPLPPICEEGSLGAGRAQPSRQFKLEIDWTTNGFRVDIDWTEQ